MVSSVIATNCMLPPKQKMLKANDQKTLKPFDAMRIPYAVPKARNPVRIGIVLGKVCFNELKLNILDSL